MTNRMPKGKVALEKYPRLMTSMDLSLNRELWCEIEGIHESGNLIFCPLNKHKYTFS